MEKSPSIKNLGSALVKFHGLVPTIEKDATNPFIKNKYASLSNILKTIMKALCDSGLTFSQFPSGPDSLTTILIHADSGEYIMAEYEMKPLKNDPQTKGSTITYQRRYALCAVLGINADDDDDGNLGSQKKTGTNEVDQAIENLKNCNSIEDLAEFRDTLPEQVVKDVKFLNAAKTRQKQIVELANKAPTT